MFDDFMVRAILAGVGVALAAAPLGCFVVWRRMAYFGDATAHAGLLGVALALALSAPVVIGVLIVAIAMALLVSSLSGKTFAADALLGVASHAALAFGVVGLSLAGGPRVDAEAFLFGDVLAVSETDLAVVWIGAALVIGLLIWRWRGLLMSTISPELAHAEGWRPDREKLFLALALAIVVAVAVKIVGALLIAAMLIIPATAARPFARTPEAMAAIAALIGIAAVFLGAQSSLLTDAPTGPAIVAAAATLFAASAVFAAVRRR